MKRYSKERAVSSEIQTCFRLGSPSLRTVRCFCAMGIPAALCIAVRNLQVGWAVDLSRIKAICTTWFPNLTCIVILSPPRSPLIGIEQFKSYSRFKGCEQVVPLRFMRNSRCTRQSEGAFLFSNSRCLC